MEFFGCNLSAWSSVVQYCLGNLWVFDFIRFDSDYSAYIRQ